jgi:peptidoglycan/LPS O-acetylase OafA/YrhL
MTEQDETKSSIACVSTRLITKAKKSEKMTSSKEYIPEIDTLRAIAVGLVLLFHAYPLIFPYGFLGVDIFFVISGFVISRSFLESLLTSRANLIDFYIGRFRRLTPALFTVLIVVSVLSYLTLFPRELESFGKSLLVQPFYLQNLYFFITGDYFAMPLSKPLLHTWSLGVEEQFYFAFGILILYCRQRGAASTKLAIASLALVSILLYIGFYYLKISPRASFFLLPFRFWQLSLGMLAYMLSEKLDRTNIEIWQASVICVGLLLLILFPIPSFSGTPYQTISVSLAAACILSFMAAASKSASVLSLKQLCYIGRISYPLYLWHWPLISIGSLWIGHELNFSEASYALFLSFALAALTYHYIERPFRSLRILRSPWEVALSVVSCSLVVVLVGFFFVHTQGATYRYPEELQTLFAASNDQHEERCPRAFQFAHPFATICPINETNGSAAVLLLGDSHSTQMMLQLSALAGKHSILLYFEPASRCMLGQIGPNQWCSRRQYHKILDEARQKGIHEVINVSIWKAESEKSKALFTENLTDTLEHGMRVTIMQQVPYSLDFDPELRARRGLRDGNVSLEGVPVANYRSNIEATSEFYRALVAGKPNLVDLIDPTSSLCSTTTCDFQTAGKPNYSDNNHLTQVGVSRIIPLFEPLFRRIVENRD